MRYTFLHLFASMAVLSTVACSGADDDEMGPADAAVDVQDASDASDVSLDADAPDTSTDVVRDPVSDALGDAPVDLGPDAPADVETDPLPDATDAGDVDVDVDADVNTDVADVETDVSDTPDQVRTDFDEVVGDVANPGRGLYWWDWNDDADIVLVKFQLGEFCNTATLPGSFIQDARARLQEHEDAGRSVIWRFNYADDGELNNCFLADAIEIEIVESHIEQLAPLFDEFAVATAYVEAGFLGMWGEWNSEFAPDGTSLVADADNRRRVLEALLDAVPEERQILVRRPRFRAEWEGTFAAADLARIGFHNDCFLASDTDRGTYDGERTVAQWKQYIGALTRGDTANVGMGGETCEVNVPRSSCATALAELEDLGFSYIHEGYHPDVIAAWDDGNCLDTIRESVGYRWLLDRVAHHSVRTAGSELTTELTVRNDGWAPIRHETDWVVSLREQGGGASVVLATETSGVADARDWLPGGAFDVVLRSQVPAGIAPGSYELTFALVDAIEDLVAFRPVFAVDGVVDTVQRIHVIGVVTIE